MPQHAAVARESHGIRCQDRIRADLVDMAHGRDDAAIAVRAVDVVMAADAVLVEVHRASPRQLEIRWGQRCVLPSRLDATQVALVDGRLEVDVGVAAPLAAEEGPDAPARFRVPVERSEHADHLPHVATEGTETRVAHEPGPLHEVVLRDIPEERIARRGIGRIEDGAAQVVDDGAGILCRQAFEIGVGRTTVVGDAVNDVGGGCRFLDRMVLFRHAEFSSRVCWLRKSEMELSVCLSRFSAVM